MSYVIEKNIPLPGKPTGPKIKYPFEQMEVGDSFQVPKESFTAASTLAYQHGMKANKKFTCRTKELRIWRVE